MKGIVRRLLALYKVTLKTWKPKRETLLSKRTLIFAGIFATVGTALLIASFAASPSPKDSVSNTDKSVQFSANQILVKIKSTSKSKLKNSGKASDTGIPSLNVTGAKAKAIKFEKAVPQGKKSNANAAIFYWYLVTLDEKPGNISAKDERSLTVQKAVSEYKNNPNVETAEPNFTMHADLVPNDPYYSSTGSWGQPYDDLWGMKKINAAAAWDQTTGSTSIVVADIDTGVDRNHPDLATNMWVNPGEVPNNGIDDDHNGYVDDYYGWDFVNGDKDPIDDHGHGSHTVGTIAGTGNNGVGVVGVNWKSKIMAVKILDANGSGYDNGIGKGLVYAADMGAKVSSNSYGGPGYSQYIADGVKYEHDKGMVTVVAAGNSNDDALKSTPAGVDYAITVAATGTSDQRACFSNFGEKIDVAAPGGDSLNCGGANDAILSVKAATNNMCTTANANIIGTNYCIVRGTSMATPHAAGLAALYLSKYPNATNEQIRQALRLGSTDLGTAGQDSSFGYGRIDAAKTINIDPATMITPSISSPTSRSKLTAAATDIIGTAAGPNFASYKLEIGNGSNWTTLNTSTSAVTNAKLGSIVATNFSDGTYNIRLTATNTAGQQFRAEVFIITIDNFDIQITSPLLSISRGRNDIYGFGQPKNGLTFASYSLDWGQGSSPTSWSTSGITLANNGTTAILPDAGQNFGGTLGNWDTSNLADGQVYTLRLTVRATNGVSASYTTSVQVDQGLAPGWPKSYCLTPNFYNSGCGAVNNVPTMADLDGDGIKDIIYVSAGTGQIMAYKLDGTSLPGFPYTQPGGGIIPRDVNVADINNDGKPEIVFGVSGTKTTVMVLSNTGVSLISWQQPTLYTSSIFEGTSLTPAIGDLNGDGIPEMVVFDRPDAATSSDGDYTGNSRIHAFEPNGTELAGFPVNFSHTPPPAGTIIGGIRYSPDPEYPPPVIADLNGDSKPEIVWSIGSQAFVFDNTGHMLPGWPYTTPVNVTTGKVQVLSNKAAVGDFNGDGKLEIFMVSHDAGINNYAKIYGLNLNGQLLSGWPKDTNDHGADVFNTPSLYDIDKDGKTDVFIGVGALNIFYGNGTSKTVFGSPSFYSDMTPILFDIDGDNTPEILAQSSAYDEGITVTNQNAQSLWSRKASPANPYDRFTIQYFNGSSIATDMNSDGKVELATDALLIAGDSSASARNVYLWQIPNASTNKPTLQWPTLGQNAARTGKLPNSPNGPPSPKSGDINGDGSVNILDLSILATHIGQTGQTLSTGDLNNDGTVNVFDLSVLAANWGT